MPIEKRAWEVLADEFPPTLATNRNNTQLEPNETPNCTGINPEREGYISTGTQPTATTAAVKTYTISAVVYKWFYNRVWRFSTTKLIWGAPEYTAVYYRQGKGEHDFTEDAQTIVTFLPIGESGLVIFKSTGAYILGNASNQGGNFQFSDFMQEAFISTATHAVELDGIVYFCNTDGVFSVDSGGKVEEISFPIHDGITPAVLTADYKNKWIKVGATHTYDVTNKRWFKYSGSTFVCETRALQSIDGNPFAVDDVQFELFHAASGRKDLKFRTRIGLRAWSKEYTVTAKYESGSYERIHQDLDTRTGRAFKVKLTSLNANLYVKRILVRVADYSAESRDS